MWSLVLLVSVALGVWRVGGEQPIAGIPWAVAQHNKLEQFTTPTPEYPEDATTALDEMSDESEVLEPEFPELVEDDGQLSDFPADPELDSSQRALDEMLAKNDAIKREYPQLAKVDDQAFSGGNLNQQTGAPTGDNFGRVTPSRLGRGNALGGIQNLTNQLMQQAFQSMMKPKPSGGASQTGQAKQAAKKPVQKQPAQKQPSTASDAMNLTATPAVGVTAAQTPEATATLAVGIIETPGATPVGAETQSAASQLRSAVSRVGLTPTPAAPSPRRAPARLRTVGSSQKNPYRF